MSIGYCVFPPYADVCLQTILCLVTDAPFNSESAKCHRVPAQPERRSPMNEHAVVIAAIGEQQAIFAGEPHSDAVVLSVHTQRPTSSARLLRQFQNKPTTSEETRDLRLLTR
jgi:hypothetical protein